MRLLSSPDRRLEPVSADLRRGSARSLARDIPGQASTMRRSRRRRIRAMTCPRTPPRRFALRCFREGRSRCGLKSRVDALRVSRCGCTSLRRSFSHADRRARGWATRSGRFGVSRVECSVGVDGDTARVVGVGIVNGLFPTGRWRYGRTGTVGAGRVRLVLFGCGCRLGCGNAINLAAWSVPGR